MAQTNTTIFDIAGIGIGPFNLGLAALSAGSGLRTVFFEQRRQFEWHPGLLLPEARMQVPFYADLVTAEAPSSPYTYLSYLRATGGLYRHGILENLYPLRSEYLAYCRWVAGQLPGLLFGHRVIAVHYLKGERVYQLEVVDDGGAGAFYCARHVVVGVGTPPLLPEGLRVPLSETLLHASDYLPHRSTLLRSKEIVVVGSGQSAAEVVFDLLQHTAPDTRIHWHTRATRLYPMEEGPFAYAHSTPGYIDWFYGLDPATRRRVLATQAPLFKGVNAALLEAIYQWQDREYRAGNERLGLQTGSSLTGIEAAGRGLYQCGFRDMAGRETLALSDAVVLATGYRFRLPAFLDGVADRFRVNAEGYPELHRDYSVDEGHSLFFQNADLYSHGFNSADLGLGPHRNGVILRQVMGRDGR